MLVMDAQDGNRAAMEQLVGRWQRRLWAHAYRLTGDEDGAWDVCQQAWIGIIKGLRRLNDPAHFRAWAYRIVTNKAVDWVRKSAANRRTGNIEDVTEPAARAKEDTGVRELLEKLDIKKRAVLVLYYFERLSVGEIGIALGIPGGTVKSRLNSARKELRQLLEQSDGR